MRLSLAPILSIVILAFAAKSAEAFFFPPIIRIFWSNCRWGWFIIPYRVCSHNGGQAPPPPGKPPPPPLVCGSDQYVWNGKCENRVSWCPNSPNTLAVASSSTPCRCAGQTFVAPTGQTACTNVPHGFGYCETNAGGASSSCKVKCDAGYSNRSGKCYKDKLLISDCATTETIGIGDKGEGCICVPKPTSASGGSISAQPCPPMEIRPSPFSPLQRPGGNANGDMSCKLDPVSNSEICIPECDPGYEPVGRICKLKGP